MMWLDAGVGCESAAKSVTRISRGHDCDRIAVLAVWFCETSVD